MERTTMTYKDRVRMVDVFRSMAAEIRDKRMTKEMVADLLTKALGVKVSIAQVAGLAKALDFKFPLGNRGPGTNSGPKKTVYDLSAIADDHERRLLAMEQLLRGRLGYTRPPEGG